MRRRRRVYYQRCITQFMGGVVEEDPGAPKPRKKAGATPEVIRAKELAKEEKAKRRSENLSRQLGIEQSKAWHRWMRSAVRASKRLSRAELAFKDEVDAEGALSPMPTSDLQCRAIGLGDKIPCPYVRCAHHLGIEVMRSGALRVIYPHWEDGADDAEPTCVLAESNREHTAAEMGKILGVGIDRILQIESDAIAKVAARMGMRPAELRKVLESRKLEE